ncbi:MerR family transcriptional regulator [Zeaxanthinibacter sp. PT1]|uniref:MerR family transcriptional regulator n=1 Tax=Zeaxanthinibacter TaxID=561554 RepID=UPI00234B47A5|nr:MerR family transcriptional regulator [Zeaxanthinibacter sp. PT1]MDC6351918.1 MerR family transcriptional regulator [Zeaxanthinibacter sp. PT1]
MNNVKKIFSIRDLENLSGIKAHTIRIWEKRYELLSPERTSTNIRTYSLESLQKLLNITLLYNNGWKISKIAEIPEDELPLKVRELVAHKSVKSHAVNSFKLSMVNFDPILFNKTYSSLKSEKSFRDIFWEIFIPFLEELGLLWQADGISPSHEHFITHLIKQKIIANTDKMEHVSPTRKDKMFVLFLPENEIHDIGLLYLNYELLLRGYQTIFLGATMPLEFMTDMEKNFTNLHFLSYFTVVPTKEKLHDYISEFTKKINKNNESSLWLLGQKTKYLTKDNLPGSVKAFESIQELLEVV